MKINTYLVFMAFIFGLVSFSQSKNETQISGKIEAIKHPTTLTIIAPSLENKGIKMITVTTDKNGSFQTTLEYDQPTQLVIQHGVKNYGAILPIDDKIKILIDKNRIHLKGKDSLSNVNYLESQQLINKRSFETYLNAIDGINNGFELKDYINKFFIELNKTSVSQSNNNLKLFNDYMQFNRTIVPLKELLYHLINKNLISEKIDFYILKKINQELRDVDYAGYFDYVGILNIYNVYLDQLSLNLYQDKIYQNQLHPKIIEIITTRHGNRSTLTKNLLYLRFISEYGKGSSSTIDASSVVLKNLLSNSKFENPLLEKLQKLKDENDAKNNDETYFKPEIYSLKEVVDARNLINEIASNSSKEFLIIDHWTTWCGPCINEFKTLGNYIYEELRHKLNFAYICHGSKKENWDRLINRYQLKGQHYYLSENQSKLLVKSLKIDSYPKTTIINSKGQIIFNNRLKGSNYKDRISEILKIIKQN